MLLFTLIFSHTSLASTDSNIPYPVFVLSGLIMWNLFHQSVSHAADSMIVNASIIKKIYFPRLLIPVSNLFTAVFDFVIAFVVFLLLCLYYHQPPDILALVFFPLAILICLIASFGLGSLLGALNVKYRDFRYALPFVLQIGFFMSQVIYIGLQRGYSGRKRKNRNSGHLIISTCRWQREKELASLAGTGQEKARFSRLSAVSLHLLREVLQ